MAKKKKTKFVPVVDRNKDPIFKGENGKFYWHLFSGNGNLVGQSAQGSGFETRAGARKNMKAVEKALTKYYATKS